MVLISRDLLKTTQNWRWSSAVIIVYNYYYYNLLRGNNISIQRKPLNEATFEKGIQPIKSTVKDTWYKSFIPPEPIRTSLLPPLNTMEWVNFLLTHLPILSWIWGYQWSYIFGDIIGGITVAIMHIPQGMGINSYTVELPSNKGPSEKGTTSLVFTSDIFHISNSVLLYMELIHSQILKNDSKALSVLCSEVSLLLIQARNNTSVNLIQSIIVGVV